MECLKACLLGAGLLYFPGAESKRKSVDETPNLSRPLWSDIISLDCLQYMMLFIKYLSFSSFRLDQMMKHI